MTNKIRRGFAVGKGDKETGNSSPQAFALWLLWHSTVCSELCCIGYNIRVFYFIACILFCNKEKKKKRCCSYNAINKNTFFFVRTFKSFWGAVLRFHCAYFLFSEYLDWPRNTQNKWSKHKICCCLPLCSGTTEGRLCWKYLLHSSPLKLNRKCHLFYKTVMLFE